MQQLIILLSCWAVGLSPTLGVTLDFEPTKPITKIAHLNVKDSPFQFDHDIQIAPKGTLIIEAGVTIKFAAGFGIICNGTLRAQVFIKLYFLPLIYLSFIV